MTKDDATEQLSAADQAVMVEIGARMRAARNAWNLSQDRVATALGVDQGLYSKWERGERVIGLLRLLRFADRMRVSMEFLAFGIPYRCHPDVLAWIHAHQMTKASEVVLRPTSRDGYMDNPSG